MLLLKLNCSSNNSRMASMASMDSYLLMLLLKLIWEEQANGVIAVDYLVVCIRRHGRCQLF